MVNPTTKCKCAPQPYTDIDWETRKANPWNFECRLADAYLGKSIESDMSFYLELDDITIPAHSLIVSAASPVLEKLIHGTGDIVTTNRVVNVPDCPEEEFMLLLRYLYTGKFNEEELDIAGATVLLPLAHYFDLYHLEIICANNIEKNLTTVNVCETFDKIHVMDNPITSKCIEFMQENTIDILANGSLMSMQDPALNKVLALDKLALKCESDLLQPMLDWADKQCINNELEVNSANRRVILKDRIYLIRFAAMTPEVFGKCIQMCGNYFFSNEEVGATMSLILFEKEFKSTMDQRFFICKRRNMNTLDLKIVHIERKLPKNEKILSYPGPQEIFLRDKTQLATFVGFETDAIVSSISDGSYEVEYPFVQMGRRVTFNSPIKFSDGQCSIRTVSNATIYFAPIDDGNSFAYLNTGKYTLFTSILVYRNLTKK